MMTQYKSKVDIVYEGLMEGIAEGAYQQGDRLVISQISKQWQVSDIPVREAVRRLESEGYVRIVANQGAVVCGFDRETLTSIFQIKGVLEGYATRLSIDYITPEILARLREMNEQMKEAFYAGDAKRCSELNRTFHLEMYRHLPNQELYHMICDLWKKWGITKTVFAVAPDSTEESLREHEEILRLIEEKQYDAVEQYVRRHKFRAGEGLTAKLSK